MKHLVNLLKSGLLALLPLLLKAKLVAGAGGVLSVVFPALGGILGANPLALAGTALYWLEILVRAVPTVASYTPLTIVLQILQAIVPNQASTPDGAPAVHETTSVFKRLFHRAPVEVSPDLEPAPAAPSLADIQAQLAQLQAATAPAPIAAAVYSGAAR